MTLRLYFFTGLAILATSSVARSDPDRLRQPGSSSVPFSPLPGTYPPWGSIQGSERTLEKTVPKSTRQANKMEKVTGDGEDRPGRTVSDTARSRGDGRSSGMAALLSLAVPGAGQAYAGRGTSARFFLFTEGALWVGQIGFRLLAGARDKSFKGFSAAHAGVRVENKGERYFDEVASYTSIYIRNSVARFLDGPDADQLSETPENVWEWDSEASRIRFQKLRSASTSARRNALLFVGGLVLNRFIGAIHAASAARSGSAPPDASGVVLLPNPRGGWVMAMTRRF